MSKNLILQFAAEHQASTSRKESIGEHYGVFAYKDVFLFW